MGERGQVHGGVATEDCSLESRSSHSAIGRFPVFISVPLFWSMMTRPAVKVMSSLCRYEMQGSSS